MTEPSARPSTRTRRLLQCGVVSGPLFMVTLVAQDVTKPGFDPMRHPGSSLALGERGWIQIANFLVSGLLVVAFAIGLRRSLRSGHRRSLLGPLLVGAWGVGLIGAGVFVTDPVSGYPPGTPAQGVHTWHGTLHDVPFSVGAFFAMIAAFLVFTRRFAGWGQPWWALYSAATGVLFTVGFFLFGSGFEQTPGLVDVAGLLQRLTLTVGWAWLTLLAIHMLSHTPADPSPN